MVLLEVHTGLGYTHHCRASSAGPGSGTADGTEDSHKLSTYYSCLVAISLHRMYGKGILHQPEL